MRWKTIVTGLALALASAVGCKQQCFLAECDYNDFIKNHALPPNLPCDPSVSVVPATSNIAAPATVIVSRTPGALSLAGGSDCHVAGARHAGKRRAQRDH